MPEQLDIAGFRALREYLRETSGLWLADDKYPRVAESVGSRMSTLGMGCFSEYKELLTASPRGRDELASLAALLTVGETYFFRDKDQWRAFAECVLPWILGERAGALRRRLRIWSAGCSTGEEAYTVGMVLRECLTDLVGWSIEIIGTDIDPVAVAAAKKAVYTENSFRGVSPELKERYFESVDGGRYRPRVAIREMVRFQELNLLDTRAVANMCDVDVIFCRNVMIYFDSSAVEALLTQLHQSLRSGGYLFLGHAESVRGRSAGFASVNVCNTIIHKSIPSRTCHVEPAVARQSPGRATSAQAMPNGSGEQPRPRPEQRQEGIKQASRIDATSLGHHGPYKCARADGGKSSDRKLHAQPEAVAVAEAPSVDDLRARAVGWLCVGENAAARHAFAEILKHQPDDAQSLLGTALLLAGSGSSDAALEYCDRVLQIAPMSAEAHCVMALVREGLGEDNMAQRELDKAVYLDDGFTLAHFRLACLHERTGRLDAASREFSNALRALADDDEQRVRIYSGGFDKETIARLCEQRLGSELPVASRRQKAESLGA